MCVCVYACVCLVLDCVCVHACLCLYVRIQTRSVRPLSTSMRNSEAIGETVANRSLRPHARMHACTSTIKPHTLAAGGLMH